VSQKPLDTAARRKGLDVRELSLPTAEGKVFSLGISFPINGNWQQPILYSKAAWTCNAIANDPQHFPPGQSFLEKEYDNNIAALNASWGSNYTSFCDAGGFGSGTGVLDEDGRHLTGQYW
jgi:hypothetical protein